MRIRLEAGDRAVASERLAAAIAGRIRRGSLGPGERLPTVRALAAELDLAPNTVAKAYRKLEADGMIEGRGRSGTFVAERLEVRALDRERLLSEAAQAYVRRGARLGFDDAVMRRALLRALRDRGPR